MGIDVYAHLTGQPLDAEAAVQIRTWWTGRRARRIYFACDRALGELWSVLDDSGADARLRGTVLAAAAGELGRQAAVHERAFGPAPIPEEGGRDTAESLASEAEVVWWLAATEIEAATRFGWQSTLDAAAARNGRTPAPQWAQPVLDQLCRTSDLVERAALVELLADEAVVHIGGQAAETVAWVAEAYRGLAAEQVSR